jgi:hypothetical protein
MLRRILAATLVVGGAMATSGAALAQGDPAAAVAAGVATGVLVATGAVPVEHREPLHQYVIRENRPSVVYQDEIEVGREFRGPHETYALPDQYGVTGHRYAVVNEQYVVIHPTTKKIVYTRRR